MAIFRFSLILILFFSLAVPALAAEEHSADLPIPVFVSIAPQAYFVRQIGGDRVRVEVLVRPGASPATYAPTPKQLVRLAKAKLFFRIGVPFESALVKRIRSAMPGVRVVDTSKAVKRPVKGHGHGSELDPHTWMDPMLVKEEGKVIVAALSEVDPAGREIYAQNYQNFAAQLDAVDKKIRAILRPFKGRTVLAYHPAYGYFCRAYGLHQEAIESGGKAPGAQHLARLIAAAKQKKIRAILVQPQFSKKKASLIAKAIGAEIIVADPLAANYMESLEKLAEDLARVFNK